MPLLPTRRHAIKNIGLGLLSVPFSRPNKERGKGKVIEAKTEMLQKSLLFVAHPDDEVLWFSSIVDKVDEVAICLLGFPSKPHWTEGRKKTIERLPLKKVYSLNIEEAQAYNTADWPNPSITPYGLDLTRKGYFSEDLQTIHKRYQQIYSEVKAIMRIRLKDKLNVFTHNPWGEYGNEDHIQMYRLIKDLQTEMGFTLWYTNYCSNKSFNLMLRHISGFHSDYVSLPTNPSLAEPIKQIYQSNQCWTWYNDWIWFKDECFMRDTHPSIDSADTGHLFPLNMIKQKY